MTEFKTKVFLRRETIFMSRVENKKSTGSLFYTAGVLGLVAIAFCFGLTTTSQVEAGKDAPSAAPAATFAADTASLGTFPDGTGTPTCGNAGSGNRDVTFTVTGLTANVSSVAVSFSARHTWINDLDVSLRAPGGSPNLLLFGRTGSTSTNDCGTGITPASLGSNDLVSTNTYTFADSASANWWTTAGSATLIPTSSNRTVVSGGPGVTNPPTTTSLNTTFGGMAPAAANGTWTLRFTDRGVGDTGAVNAASLIIETSTPPPPGQRVVDFDGDGKTDSAVVRNTGGGPSGQITWFAKSNGGSVLTLPNSGTWGAATDFFVPEDYDGDGKSDLAVWRGGAPGNAAFYIFQSATNTARIETFGQSGDDPTVVGDYDGDGKADLAVYRGGAVAGDVSTWFYRTTAAGPVFGRVWGQNGDFPSPGDYDGDGKNDFGVQRNAGTGQAVFFFNYAAAAPGVQSRFVYFGTPTDLILPGDYDGDGKTDVAVSRGISGTLNWFYEPSTALGTFVGGPFGASATDFQAQGDYDGDGKTDFAVFRPNADPTQNFFLARKSSDGSLYFDEWGSQGDYPVANFNSH